MKRVLDPLAHVPGVRRALLISRDGVPITHLDGGAAAEAGGSTSWAVSSEDLSAFAGMATGLMAEIHRAVDPLSWGMPQRIVLRAARGTLILVGTQRVTLAVELERGMAAEELRLPMESTIARLRRALERSAPGEPKPVAAQRHTVAAGDATTDEPPGLFPGATEASDAGSDTSASFGTGVPETTTES